MSKVVRGHIRETSIEWSWH